MQALVENAYARLVQRSAEGRQRSGRALTLTEKILLGHLEDIGAASGKDTLPERRRASVGLRPDRGGHAGRHGTDGPPAVHARRYGTPRRCPAPCTATT